MCVAFVPLSSSNTNDHTSNMNIGGSVEGRSTMTDKPTDNDVLLGRGVATNRHPGNETFRAIVSQHVDVYLVSTKNKKTSISRSIVSKVNNELFGRFLEKKSSTGLWHEVDIKRALEKTAQALRDGAALIRKQLSDDMSDPSFFDAVFDQQDEANDSTSGAVAENKAKKTKKRTKVPAEVRTKKQRTLAAEHVISLAQEQQQSDFMVPQGMPAFITLAQEPQQSDYVKPQDMPALQSAPQQQQQQQQQQQHSLYLPFAAPSSYNQQLPAVSTNTFDILNQYAPIPLHQSYAASSTTTAAEHFLSLVQAQQQNDYTVPQAPMEALSTPSASAGVEPTLSFHNNSFNTAATIAPLVPSQPQQYKHRRSLTNEDFLFAAGLGANDDPTLVRYEES